MQLSNFKTSVKLVLAFVLVALIGAGMGSYAIYNMKRIKEADTRLYQHELIGLSLIKEANIERLKGVVALRDTLLATTEQERQNALKRLKDARAAVLTQLEQAGQIFLQSEARTALAQLKAAWIADEQAMEGALKMVLASELLPRSEALGYIQTQFQPQSVKIGGAMTELSKRKEQDAAQVSEANTALYESSRNTTLLLVLLGVVAGVALGLAISRHVTRPLAAAVASAQRMSEGDMTQALDADGRDEISQLLKALERMRAELLKMVASVRSNAEGVATASAEIAQGNADLSQRTEQQASALQQTAATDGRGGRDRAQQRRQRAAGQSAGVGRVGGGRARRRGGGRGGADHAGHQRELEEDRRHHRRDRRHRVPDQHPGAQRRGGSGARGRAGPRLRGGGRRSAQPGAAQRRGGASEIKGLIGTSVERVGQGSALADRAGRTMGEVVTAIRRVTDIVGEISSASREQSTGIAQVGEAVTQMDKVTQQNAALVEQSAAAAESMKIQAQQLVTAMGFFRLAR